MPVCRLRFWPVLLFLATSILAGHPAIASNDDQPTRIDVGGFRLNSVLLRAGRHADVPPIVFIHGASASLYDPMLSFREKLEGRAKLLFVDRPGHGQSDIGGEQNILPDGQADAIATLMRKRRIGRAIVVSHSFGGAIAAALATRHPDLVSGPLFSALVVPPVGLFAIDRATRAVFAPNQRPSDYIAQTRALQALRPAAFRHNAQEVAALIDWAKRGSLAYRRINAPTVIITGDADGIVSPDIHAKHLARDIRGSRLIVVHNLGHKSDYVASDLAIAAIETVAGKKVSLMGVAKTVERRIAYDGKK